MSLNSAAMIGIVIGHDYRCYPGELDWLTVMIFSSHVGLKIRNTPADPIDVAGSRIDDFLYLRVSKKNVVLAELEAPRNGTDPTRDAHLAGLDLEARWRRINLKQVLRRPPRHRIPFPRSRLSVYLARMLGNSRYL